MQSGSDYANQQIKDKQAKMRDFINQTKQDRDYFREQNYPKNSQNSLTSARNSGNINNIINNQFYAPLNFDNAERFIANIAKQKGNRDSFEEKTIMAVVNRAISEINAAPKNQRRDIRTLWNIAIANMQKPVKLSELSGNFYNNLVKSINARHVSGEYASVVKVFNSVAKDIPVLNQYVIGSAFYSPMTYVDKKGKEMTIAGININKAEIGINDYTTELHEIGHYIDMEILHVDKENFRKTLLSDFKDFYKRKNFPNIKWDDVFDLAPETADILYGLTKGRYGSRLHSNEYWKDPKKLPAETFAHFFEATIRNDKRKIEIYKNIFPKSYKKFLKSFD